MFSVFSHVSNEEVSEKVVVLNTSVQLHQEETATTNTFLVIPSGN